MRFSQFVPAAATVALLSGHAAAQTGTQDQDSPRTNASYNEDADFLIWQQQVRAGVAGQLEGIVLTLFGNAGAHMDIRVRLGDAPSTNPVLFSAGINKAVTGQEIVFVNMTAANITLTAGQTFVMETQGNNTGTNLIGSYVDPNTGPPLY